MTLMPVAVAAALGLAILGGPADAAAVIDISQVGGDVVTAGSGTVDLTDLSLYETLIVAGVINPGLGGVLVGNEGTASVYTGVGGPASFGTGGLTEPSSISGDILGIAGSTLPLPEIFVPEGYVSGAALSGSATYDGATLASLGLTSGKYVYTWGAGPDADSLTVNIGIGSAIPEPSTWAMMLLGFAGVGFAGYRRARELRAA